MGIVNSNMRSRKRREADRTRVELAETPPREFDPGDHTVGEVLNYLALHPRANVNRILEQERAGKNRKGIIDHLTLT